MENLNKDIFLPKYIFFTVGGAVHEDKLHSFELALREAKIESFNLVNVSSILPPNCQIISREEGLAKLYPGQIVYCVLARETCSIPGIRISAAIGCAFPESKGNCFSRHGYLSEVHERFITKQEASDLAEDRAAEMLSTTMGVHVDWKKLWNKEKEIYEIKGRPVKTRSYVMTKKTPTVPYRNPEMWTTVVAAAVFCF